ncbi:MAG: DNA polymerase III subunit gamma/tau [Planctomycetes bacterium]|nr:DNA polymerase III subunit gamma/tau [Planctomycetota bacterium]
MSYRVIARKYRPRTFAQVVGQDHIVKALSRAIEKDRVGQAYLLMGPRGVGKTSSARILAKSLNCEQGESISPCLACAPCLEIEVGADLDVVEIDGASNNGVEDVRKIRERVHFRPIRDRRKIYIIDEVQRLTGAAFDALLKTLEEPPGHAVFLFATTDPHKIPETISSRCQIFEFRRLREEDIEFKLNDVCEKEGVEVPAEVLSAIAGGCRGGLRDAESMLDQLLAVADGTPNLDDLEMISGLARPERWLDLFSAVAGDDGRAVLSNIEEFLAKGGTERDFVEQAVDALRDLLHVTLLGEDSLGVVPSPERRERTLQLAGKFGRDRIETLMGMLFQLEGKIRQAPLAARALLEWTLLRAGRMGDLLSTASLAHSLQSAPRALSQPGAPSAGVPASPVVSAAPIPAPPPPSTPSASLPPLGVDELLKVVVGRQPTLGKVLVKRKLMGVIKSDGVELTLSALSERDRAIVEDSASKVFLADFPGSPGPWTIHEETPPPEVEDPTGAQLKELFGGSEEIP